MRRWGWRAWVAKGLPGEPVRDMLIEAVEKRFGAVDAIPAQHALEFLSDNGGAYTSARHPTDRPCAGPEANPHAGMQSPAATASLNPFVNTFRRDYVSRMDLSDAATVLAQLPAAFEHFNEIHPHSSLEMRSPREFRRGNEVRP